MSEKRTIPEAVADAVLQAVIKSLSKDRDASLTPIGFEWAFWLELRRHGWRVSRNDAQQWLWPYADAPHGHPDYGWTAADAEHLAREYVAEFGEAA